MATAAWPPPAPAAEPPPGGQRTQRCRHPATALDGRSPHRRSHHRPPAGSDQLAEDGQGNGDGGGFSHHPARFCGLGGLIRHQGTHQHIGIGCDVQASPLQPFAAACWISSRLAVLLLRPASSPMNPSIEADGWAARTSIRPPGRADTSICSPGLTPRCRSNSCRSVTWPLAQRRCGCSTAAVHADFA